MASVNNQIRVNRAQLRQAFRQISQVSGRNQQQPAVMTYQDGLFRIEFGGCKVAAEAEGTWNGQVQIPADAAISIAKSFLPAGDDALVSTDGDELRVDNFVCACHWNALVYPRIEMTINATLSDYLILPMKYSREDIERSGLSKDLVSAEERRDELFALAARKLRPLRIREKDLRDLLDRLLDNRNRGESDGA